jgi:predicted DNA binding CopG/RHH family protein
MKKIRLNRDEAALEKSFGTSSWKERPLSEIKRFEKAAAQSMEARKKEARVNIRMSELDVALLKKKAQDEGLPYQSLMSSIIHKYVTEQFVEKKYVDMVAKKLRLKSEDEAA